LVGLMEWWVVGVVWWRVWSRRRGVLLSFAVKSLVDVLLVVTVRRRITVACMCFLLVLLLFSLLVQVDKSGKRYRKSRLQAFVGEYARLYMCTWCSSSRLALNPSSARNSRT
jgi:hypothetical protein